MLELIRDVLAFSQLAKFKPEYVDIDLNEILANIRNDFELLIEEKGARIEASRLPLIKGVRVQMIQLFGNLLSNSLKFSSAERKPEIRIYAKGMSPDEIAANRSLDPGAKYQMISFRDNGIGFDQGNATQIFNIFQRLHSKSEYEGTGIGLAMCKKNAQNHSGDIFATSTPGEGSVFHLILPERML